MHPGHGHGQRACGHMHALHTFTLYLSLHTCSSMLGCKKRPAEHEGGDVESTALLMLLLLLLLQRHCIAHHRFRVEKGFSPFHSGACIEAVKNAASRSKPGGRLSANHML